MFVEGLYKILDDGNYKSLISWSYDGKTFFIWDKELFTNHVLKEFTAQNHFASFERQLNMYNFGRISDGRSTRKSEEYEPVEFGHDYFQRGRKDLLKLIKRRPRLASDRASCKKSTTYRKQSIHAIGKTRRASSTGSDVSVKLDPSIASVSSSCNTQEPAMTHVTFTNNSNYYENNLVTSFNLQHHSVKPEYAYLDPCPPAYSPFNLNSLLIVLNTLGIDVNAALCDPWMTQFLLSLVNQIQYTPTLMQ